MILVVIAILFLVIGVWEHGAKLAVALFLLFLALGVLDIRRGDMAPERSLVTLDASALPDLWQQSSSPR